MEIIPKEYPSNAIADGGLYICPLCEASRTDEAVDPKWVYIPVLENAICAGCCYDLYSLARSDSFDDNPYKSLYDDLARRTGTSVEDIRLALLQDQERLVTSVIEVEVDDFFQQEYQSLLREIRTFIQRIEST